ncbi:MAG: hypothetical protein COB04_12480 [Gammaproteobacteria bacterium]|nr:MAG: hypothetical protein COB04_12480 [Gammaproteobacteria bacterium]
MNEAWVWAHLFDFIAFYFFVLDRCGEACWSSPLTRGEWRCELMPSEVSFVESIEGKSIGLDGTGFRRQEVSVIDDSKRVELVHAKT